MDRTIREELRIPLRYGFKAPGRQLKGPGMMCHMVLPLLFLVILWIPFFLAGPVGATEPITLKETIRDALRNSHEIRSMESVVLAWREDVGIAMSHLLPGFFFEERAMRTNNPTYAFMAKLNLERFTARDFELERLNNPDAVTDYQASLCFEQPLFAPKAYIGVSISKKEAIANEEDLKRKREEVAFLDVRACPDIRTAAAFFRVADRTVADIREPLRRTELRIKTVSASTPMSCGPPPGHSGGGLRILRHVLRSDISGAGHLHDVRCCGRAGPDPDGRPASVL